MSYQDKNILRNRKGDIVPQYFNDETESYEPAKGKNGAVFSREVGTIVKEIWSGNENVVKTWERPCYGFSIVNDGSEDIYISINNISFVVKAWESFEDRFPPFTQLTIETTSDYRAYVKE